MYLEQQALKKIIPQNVRESGIPLDRHMDTKQQNTIINICGIPFQGYLHSGSQKIPESNRTLITCYSNYNILKRNSNH